MTHFKPMQSLHSSPFTISIVKKTMAEVMTAAEKRAARRARVLQGGESRMRLVTGQISSLKDEPGAELPLEQQQVERELETEASDLVAESGGGAAELKVPTRVDPAQRRRDAAARRKRKEEAVQELLGGKKAEEVTKEEESGEVEKVKKLVEKKDVEKEKESTATFSRHSLALQLQVAQDKAVALVLVVAAVYVGEILCGGFFFCDEGDEDVY